MIAQLPDPLMMLSGVRVRTQEEWYTKRRPELKSLFQHYVYGNMPSPCGITAKVTKTASGLLDGRCSLKEVVIKLDGLPADAPCLRLAIFLPNAARSPTPVFLALNRCGNQTIVNSPDISINESAWLHPRCQRGVHDARGAELNSWCVESLVERGYALATLHESDIAPDDSSESNLGVRRFFPNMNSPHESRWGTLAAWAWGLQRAVDYLATDPQIDARQIALLGHSRRGKAALLAAAFDERVALVVPHQSGTGGMALSRDNDQETVERITRAFPHWFNDVFPQLAEQEEKLPVDQHLLVALVAPRALLDTEGLQDRWANYDNSLRSLHAADPVWKFLVERG